MILGWLEFILAISLLGLLVLLVLSRWTNDPTTAFFSAVALVGLDLGSIAVLTSSFHALTPLGWLLAQTLLTAVVFLMFRSSPIAVAVELISITYVRLRSIRKDRIAFAGLVVLAFIMSASLIHQLRTPVLATDDTNYVGARVGYWLQHHDLFHYRNNNDRQVVFTFGGELFLLFPLLFTRLEWTARFLIWFAYPASAIGVILLSRMLALSHRGAVWAAVLFSAAPQVFAASACIKPELWSVVYALGAVFFSVSSLQATNRPYVTVLFAGILSGLAITTKFTMVILVPPLLVASIVTDLRSKIQRFVSAILGLLTGIIGGGAAVTIYQNICYEGHPFGPAGLREVVSADLGPSQLWIHSMRLVARLVDIPILPWQVFRLAIDSIVNAFIDFTGAARPLRWEVTSSGWPGLFQYHAGTNAHAFSLVGILWLPALAIALWRAIAYFIESHRIRPNGIIAFFCAITLAGIVYGLRWQQGADVPFRFLLPSFALGVVLVVAEAEKFVVKRPKSIYWIAGLVIFTILPTLYDCARVQERPWALRLWPSPYAKVAALVPIGSRIIHIGDQNAPEYYLFDPQRGYQNSVFPWGKDHFNARSLQEFIDTVHPTHVLVENDRQIFFHWHPSIDTRPFVEWLVHQPDFRELRPPQPGMRLFAVHSDFKSHP